MLAIVKATSVDICRFFSKPGPYVSCDTMEFLLARYDGELDVDAVDSEGRTTIHVVVREGHTRVIRFCVTMGGNPNRVDSKGWTPTLLRSVEGAREGCGVFVGMLQREVREGQGREKNIFCCRGELLTKSRKKQRASLIGGIGGKHNERTATKITTCIKICADRDY
ncbi:hypothetical protein JHK87_002905 [Glycine soja]|nr:hypothetical protein JHK87_002905 [Glycine soja]